MDGTVAILRFLDHNIGTCYIRPYSIASGTLRALAGWMLASWVYGTLGHASSLHRDQLEGKRANEMIATERTCSDCFGHTVGKKCKDISWSFRELEALRHGPRYQDSAQKRTIPISTSCFTPLARRRRKDQRPPCLFGTLGKRPPFQIQLWEHEVHLSCIAMDSDSKATS